MTGGEPFVALSVTKEPSPCHVLLLKEAKKMNVSELTYRLKRKSISFILMACIIIPLCLNNGCFDPVSAAEEKQTGVVYLGKINIDGEDIDCVCCESNDVYYYRLKDLAYLLNGTGSRFNVQYGKKLKSISITAGDPYTPDGNEMKETGQGDVTIESFKTELILNGEKNNNAPKVYKIGEDIFINPVDFRTVLNFAAECDNLSGMDYVFTYIESDIDDYSRAFEMGYVEKSWEKVNKEKQVSIKEYRSMLTCMINELAPERTSYFEQKVPELDVPMNRTMAVFLSWYASLCIGADDYNCGFNVGYIEDEFVSGGIDYEKIFPGCFSETDPETGWDEGTRASLWNSWHFSPVSGRQVIEYDFSLFGIRYSDPFLVEEAVSAVTRLWDSVEFSGEDPAFKRSSWLERTRCVSSKSKIATEPDPYVITEDILEIANANKISNIDDMPRLTGFVLASGNSFAYNSFTIETTEKDIKNVSDWGFSCVRLQFTYETFFSRDGSKVDPVRLRQLDELIAAGIKYNLHINLLFNTLPGRWIEFDYNTYTDKGELVLFKDKEKLKQAVNVWKTIAKRYKDIPGRYLSFQPIWEPNNFSLSTPLPVQEYSEYDVYYATEKIVEGIRLEDPDRFIIYETTGDLGYDTLTQYGDIRAEFESKYDNLRTSTVYADAPFVFYFLGSSEEGINIDQQQHSMYIPDYPLTIYSAQKHLEGENAMTIGGCLPKGTEIRLFVGKTGGNGSFTINDDKGELFKEALSDKEYATTYTTSGFYPFASSEKLITLILNRDTEFLTLSCPDGFLEWSGMEVVLPEEYKVERFYSKSSWDAFVNGDDPETTGTRPVMTSTVVICPNSEDSGNKLIINPDVTYSSESVFAESSAETQDDWGKGYLKLNPESYVEFEVIGDAAYDSMSRYYEDMLSMLDKYGFDWCSAMDYYFIVGAQAGIEKIYKDHLISYDGYDLFDMDRLKLFQKHRSSGLALDKRVLYLSKGEKATLKAEFISDVLNSKKGVKWTSSDPKIVSVDKNGRIMAKGNGTADITATAKDGSGTSAVCRVTVSSVPVKNIKLNVVSKTLKPGKTFKLTAVITPENATVKKILWESSDTSVVTVSKTGKIKAVGKGTATITARAADGSGITAKCKVKVK